MQEQILERHLLLLVKQLLHDFEEVATENGQRVLVLVQERAQRVHQAVVVLGLLRLLSRLRLGLRRLIRIVLLPISRSSAILIAAITFFGVFLILSSLHDALLQAHSRQSLLATRVRIAVTVVVLVTIQV